jgi:2-C-methyl-D-erythritol 4-phosphate cytidylyltransferase
MAVALIVAAGRGERLGSGRPKALVMLAGRPMLAWSIETLRAVAAVSEIVIALPPGELDAAPAGTVAVAGGATRSESVRGALHASAGGDPVIVHDAARPLAGPALFDRALADLEQYACDAAIAAAPVSDTIKQVADDGRTVQSTLDRTRLWAVQTPQVFRRAALERALAAPPELLAAATDDAWLIERAGGVVRVVQSDPGNLKVTTLTDLHVAELLLRERGG